MVSLGIRDQYGGVAFDTLGIRSYVRALEPDFLPTVAELAALRVPDHDLLDRDRIPGRLLDQQVRRPPQVLLLVLVILPLDHWVIRTYAWMMILGDNGVLNGSLGTWGSRQADRPAQHGFRRRAPDDLRVPPSRSCPSTSRSTASTRRSWRPPATCTPTGGPPSGT